MNFIIKVFLLTIFWLTINCNYLKEARYKAFVEKGKIGYIDLDGTVKIPAKYNYGKNFTEGLAAVTNDESLCGYIDKKDNIVIPFQYIFCDEFRDGIAVVRENTESNYILISRSDLKSPPIQLDKDLYYISYLGEGMFGFINNTTAKHGAIDKTGKIKVDVNFHSLSNFFYGFAKVLVSKGRRNSNLGVVDTSGFMPFKPECDSVSIDKEIIECVKTIKQCTSETCKEFKEKDQHIYYDRSGKVILQKENDAESKFRNSEFSEGLSIVKDDDNSCIGYMDKTGELVIKLVSSSCSKFRNGFAFVYNINDDSLYHLIDKSGKIYYHLDSNLTVNDSEISKDGYLRVYNRENKYGLLDKKGEIVLPVVFDFVDFTSYGYESLPQDSEYFSDGLAIVTIDAKRYFVDRKGNKLKETE